MGGLRILKKKKKKPQIVLDWTHKEKTIKRILVVNLELSEISD